jgi:hypothetical protein
MAIEFIDYDGKPRYIQGKGNFYHLSKSKNGALEDIPEGYKVITNRNGKLSLVRKNK